MLGLFCILNQQVNRDSLITPDTNKETKPLDTQPKTLTSYLIEEGFEPLDSSSDYEDWTDVVQAYSEAQTGTFDDTDKEVITEEMLQKRCEIALKQTKDHPDYLPSRQWCVKEANASNILKKGGFKILSTDNTDDDNHWETLLKQDRDNQISFSRERTIDSMKKTCKDLNINDLKTTTEGFNDTLEIIKDSCSIKTPN